MNVIFAAALLALPATSFAYIDPGTGSMAVQAVIAGVAGISVGLRAAWHRIKSMVSRDEPAASAESADGKDLAQREGVERD